LIPILMPPSARMIPVDTDIHVTLCSDNTSWYRYSCSPLLEWYQLIPILMPPSARMIPVDTYIHVSLCSDDGWYQLIPQLNGQKPKLILGQSCFMLFKYSHLTAYNSVVSVCIRLELFPSCWLASL
jgi:hypothetical protein